MPVRHLHFDHIDRHGRWKDVFDGIDNTFDKIAHAIEHVGSRVHADTFIAKQDEQEFFLESDYNTKCNNLAVYYNGVRQFVNSGFKETSSRSFALTTPANAGDRIVAVYLQWFIPNDNRSVDERFLEEIEQARRGGDGTEYPTLAASIRGQIRSSYPHIEIATEEEIDKMYMMYIAPYLTISASPGIATTEDYEKAYLQHISPNLTVQGKLPDIEVCGCEYNMASEEDMQDAFKQIIDPTLDVPVKGKVKFSDIDSFILDIDPETGELFDILNQYDKDEEDEDQNP